MKPVVAATIAAALLALSGGVSGAEEVAISRTRVDWAGRVQVEVSSSRGFYYVLHRRPDPGSDEWKPVSVTIGDEGGTTNLTEALGAGQIEDCYRVTRHRIDSPGDIDGDGIDDMAEIANPVVRNPLNPSRLVPRTDGAAEIPDRRVFEELSYQGSVVLRDAHLIDQEYVKFYIVGADTASPEVLYMNTNTHRAHFGFAGAIGLAGGVVGGGRQAGGPGRDTLIGQMRGEIVYHPSVVAPNGFPGTYRFEFEPNDAYSFEDVQMVHELLAASMGVLENNLVYYPMPGAATRLYEDQRELYESSRVGVLREEDIYASVSYVPLNRGVGYGLLRTMNPGEWPRPRDIAIYESLPNEMSRVGGIITTVPQTPLSHVNLRAIQDGVPNAYIDDATGVELISSLIGSFVYFRADEDGYEVRRASRDEVESHYRDLRPSDTQTPVRDLSVTEIAPLREIAFAQSSSFGVKTANLATMHTFDFPDGVLPDGFGVPFYFYDEFMKYNRFYTAAAVMLSDPLFRSSYEGQKAMLAEFRGLIRDGAMPDWMWDALTDMQNAFPPGTSIRVRSSTNNEDLPGFSGAGLYTSRTQHPDEGHISKSVKQVFASLWSFRAFEEREFYRVDHFSAAMGLLVHPSYSRERANGVGVTIDPFYGTPDVYYLNTQLGEDRVTNPQAFSTPEEVLLGSQIGTGHSTIRPSSLTNGRQILSDANLEELRACMAQIHDEFRMLYDPAPADDFAMEIEYKITGRGTLAIKQARPWVR